MHLKDKINENMVYSDNVHQGHAKKYKRHGVKGTILQNINQT